MTKNVFEKDCEYLNRPHMKTGFKIEFNLAARTARLTGALYAPNDGYSYKLSKDAKTDDISLHLTLVQIPPEGASFCVESTIQVDETFNIPQDIIEIFIHRVEENPNEQDWDEEWNWEGWNGDEKLPIPHKKKENISLAMYCKLKP